MPMVLRWRRKLEVGRADEWDQSNVEIFGSKEEVLTRTRGLGEVLRVKEVLNPQNRGGLGGWISQGEVQRLRSTSFPRRGGLDRWISKEEVQRLGSARRGEILSN